MHLELTRVISLPAQIEQILQHMAPSPLPSFQQVTGSDCQLRVFEATHFALLALMQQQLPELQAIEEEPGLLIQGLPADLTYLAEWLTQINKELQASGKQLRYAYFPEARPPQLLLAIKIKLNRQRG